METTRIKSWLAILAFFGFIGCLYLLFFKELPAGAKDIILIVIGALIGLVKDVYSYFFGSSSGSDRKTDLLAASTPMSTAGFARLQILYLLVVAALFALLIAGCALGPRGSSLTTSTRAERIDRLLTVAKKVNRVSGVLLDTAGPLTVATVCTAQPQDCVAAKAALILANKTHAEIKAVIASSDAANTAPDGMKLLSLGTDFLTNIDRVNSLISAYGGKPVDLTEFKTSLQTLKTETDGQ